MSDLKPCPFCGGDAYTEIYIVEAAAGCRECQFKVTREHRPYEYDGLPKVIAAWNRRALPAVQHDADELVGHMTKLIAAGLDRVEQLTAERDRLREALNQSRLAFAGHVSVQSAIDLIDRAAMKRESHD